MFVVCDGSVFPVALLHFFMLPDVGQSRPLESTWGVPLWNTSSIHEGRHELWSQTALPAAWFSLGNGHAGWSESKDPERF